MTPSDSTIIRDDIKLLIEYFCQPDEEGNCHGLDPKTVREHTKRLDGLCGSVLSLSNERLMEAYYDRCEALNPK